MTAVQDAITDLQTMRPNAGTLLDPPESVSLTDIGEGLVRLWELAGKRLGELDEDELEAELWASLSLGDEHMRSVAAYDEQNLRLMLRRRRERSGRWAPNITPILWELEIDKINGVREGTKEIEPPRCVEAVIEILEWTKDYIALEEPEVAYWLRVCAEDALERRFGRVRGEQLARKYLDPAPPVEPAYDDSGYLKPVDLAAGRNVEWLIEGVIPHGAVGMWVAPFGSGKTFLAIDLALSLAFGQPWLSRPTRGAGHVRYVAAEGAASFDKRLAAWLVSNGHLPADFSRAAISEVLDGRFALSTGALRLDDPRLEEVLVRTVREDRTRLLVLDTLGRLLGPEQSDEDNQTANSIMGALHRVAAATGATILLIHHPGHENTGRARGASAWEQAADFVFTVKGSAEDLRDGRSLLLVNRKQRDAEPASEVGYRLRSVSLSCDGEEWPGAIVESAVALVKLTIPEQIRSVVAANPGQTKGAVCSQVHGRRNTVLQEIDRMIGAGALENRGKGGAFQLHVVPDEWDTCPNPQLLGPVTS